MFCPWLNTWSMSYIEQSRKRRATACIAETSSLSDKLGIPILCETTPLASETIALCKPFPLYLAFPVPALSIDYAPLNPKITLRQHNSGLYHLLEKKTKTVGDWIAI